MQSTPLLLPLLPPPAGNQRSLIPPLSDLQVLHLADLVELCCTQQLTQNGQKAELINHLVCAQDKPLLLGNIDVVIERLMPAILACISPLNSSPPSTQAQRPLTPGPSIQGLPPQGSPIQGSSPGDSLQQAELLTPQPFISLLLSVAMPSGLSPSSGPSHSTSSPSLNLASYGESPHTPAPYYSDTMLHCGYIPPDLLASLAAGDYQTIANWMTSALITCHSMRKGKMLPESSRGPESDLSVTLWIEAMFNLTGALCSIGSPMAGHPTPLNTAACIAHADQLHAYTSFIIQCINEHYNWPTCNTSTEKSTT